MVRLVRFDLLSPGHLLDIPETPNWGIAPYLLEDTFSVSELKDMATEKDLATSLPLQPRSG